MLGQRDGDVEEVGAGDAVDGGWEGGLRDVALEDEEGVDGDGFEDVYAEVGDVEVEDGEKEDGEGDVGVEEEAVGEVADFGESGGEEDACAAYGGEAEDDVPISDPL